MSQTYTFYVAFGPLDALGKPTDETSIEEIDVTTDRGYTAAVEAARAELAADYEPGGVILHSATVIRPAGMGLI